MNIGRPQKGLLSESKDETELSKLMQEAQGGDSASYNRLLTRITEMLRGYVRKSVPGEMSEDIIQEIVMAVHMKRHTFNSEQYFLPWLYAIARYKVIDHLRKKGRSERLFSSVEDFDLFNVSDVAMSVEELSPVRLEEVIACLPSKQLAIVKAVKLEGLSVKDAANKLGYSESDIKVSIHRALKTLSEKFGRE